MCWLQNTATCIIYAFRRITWQIAVTVSDLYILAFLLILVMWKYECVKRETSGQSNLKKAAPNDPTQTDRQTDRQTPRTSVTIVRISCIRCSLKTKRELTMGPLQPSELHLVIAANRNVFYERWKLLVHSSSAYSCEVDFQSFSSSEHRATRGLTSVVHATPVISLALSGRRQLFVGIPGSMVIVYISLYHETGPVVACSSLSHGVLNRGKQAADGSICGLLPWLYWERMRAYVLMPVFKVLFLWKGSANFVNK